MSSENEKVWSDMQASQEFQTLKKKYRSFAFPVTIAFLVWYFGYILITAFAREWASEKVFGNINVAFLLGIGQFLSTFIIAWLYERHSSKHLDAASDKLRDEIDGKLAK